MRGLLADVNVQRHALVLRHRLEALGLWPVLVELGLTLATFRDVELARDLDDRPSGRSVSARAGSCSQEIEMTTGRTRSRPP
jgi:hypothetical protein